jgi:hypothetical protein
LERKMWQHLGRADAVEQLGAGALLPALADLGRQGFAGGGAHAQGKLFFFGKAEFTSRAAYKVGTP